MTAFSLTADHIAQAVALQAQAKTASDTPFIDALADVIAKEAGADLEFAWPFAAGVVDKMAQDATSLSPALESGSTKGIFSTDLAQQYLHGDRINSAGDIVDVPSEKMRSRRMLIQQLLGKKPLKHDAKPGAARTKGNLVGGAAGAGIGGILGTGAGKLLSMIPKAKPISKALQIGGGLTGAITSGGVAGKAVGAKFHQNAEAGANKETVKTLASALGANTLRTPTSKLDTTLGRLQDAFGHQDAEAARGRLRGLVSTIDG